MHPPPNKLRPALQLRMPALPIRARLSAEGFAVPQTRTIETTLAAWSLLAGLVANFTGFMLFGRLAWPLCLALIAIGTGGLVGAILLVAAADRNHRTASVSPVVDP
jgi:hypothetical protein